MRILILSQYFHPEIGAPQARLISFVKELVRKGHAVEVVTSLPSYPTNKIFPSYQGVFYRRETFNGVRIHRSWIYPATGAGFKRMLNYGSFLITCFFGLFLSKDFDFLFVESPPLFLYFPARIFTIFKAKPYIFNVADLWPDSMFELGLVRNRALVNILQFVEKKAYEGALFVNAVTNGIGKTLIEKKSVPQKKILFLPNGVDVELFRPIPYDLSLAQKLKLNKKKVILYAGTHGYAHNIDVALRSAHLLKKENIFFLFIGDGSEKNRLEELSAKMRLDNVIFLPSMPAEELVKYYSIAFAGLSTLGRAPLFESTRPAKVLSIMAMGKPVIYSGNGEGARLVEDANAGIVVAPDDDEALAMAIKRLAVDRDAADLYGRNGRKFVSKNLSWPIVVDNWVKSFEEASNEKKLNR